MIKLSRKIELCYYERFVEKHFPYIDDDLDALQEYFRMYYYDPIIEDNVLHGVNYERYYAAIGFHPEEIKCIENDDVYTRNINILCFSVWMLHNKHIIEMLYL